MDFKDKEIQDLKDRCYNLAVDNARLIRISALCFKTIENVEICSVCKIINEDTVNKFHKNVVGLTKELHKIITPEDEYCDVSGVKLGLRRDDN